jgi:hypothetical protein
VERGADVEADTVEVGVVTHPDVAVLRAKELVGEKVVVLEARAQLEGADVAFQAAAEWDRRDGAAVQSAVARDRLRWRP